MFVWMHAFRTDGQMDRWTDRQIDSDKCVCTANVSLTQGRLPPKHLQVLLNVVFFLGIRELLYAQPWYDRVNPVHDIHIASHMWMLPGPELEIPVV